MLASEVGNESRRFFACEDGALFVRIFSTKAISHSWTRFLIGAIALTVVGCAYKQENVQIEMTAEDLYNIALNTATSGDIQNAPAQFDEVERQHPYSKWATRAQLMSAWSLYQGNNYDAAVVSLNRFIELNPSHENIDYAYYLRAMSYYEQIVDVERDAGMTVLTQQAFEALLRRFPNSEYSRDGQLKLDLAKSHLAGKEMAVGRFYMKREHYDAALRRFSVVIKDYQTSNQVPEALYRMVESYLALELDVEAERAGSVLKYNYPDSVWTSRMILLIGNPETDHEPGLLKNLFERATEIF